MERSDLEEIIKGNISLIYQVNVRDIALQKNKVEVQPADVNAMLDKYLTNKLSAEQLNNWASFVVLRGEYMSPETDNVDDDYYEDLWSVIEALSLPEIDGEITPSRVREYKKELEKYDDPAQAKSMYITLAQYHCEKCKQDFFEPSVEDDEDNILLLRTSNGEIACLNMEEDRTYYRLQLMVESHQSLFGEVENTNDLANAIFYSICEPSPAGEYYKFDQFPRCPNCGNGDAETLLLQAEAAPTKKEYPAIQHRQWDQLSREEQTQHVYQLLKGEEQGQPEQTA